MTLRKRVAMAGTLVLAIGVVVGDTNGQDLYWADSNAGTISLNGVPLVTSLGPGPSGLALGPTVDGGKIYFVDGEIVKRANLADGQNVQNLVKGLSGLHSVKLDVPRGKMYWTDGGPGNEAVQRANLDGTNVETLVDNGGADPQVPGRIALDLCAGRMYWNANVGPPGGGTIFSANLDGTNQVALYSNAIGYSHVVLDLSARKIYWTVRNIPPNLSKIQRANLDGTGDIEDLVVEPVAAIEALNALALDVSAELMYFFDTGTGRLLRANMEVPPGEAPDNRTDIETLFTGVSAADIALDIPSIECPAIPTVSEWGLMVMALLVLTAGTLVYARRCPIRA